MYSIISWADLEVLPSKEYASLKSELFPLPVIIKVIGFPICQPLEEITSLTTVDKSGVLWPNPDALSIQEELGVQTTLEAVVFLLEILLDVLENVDEYAISSPFIVISILLVAGLIILSTTWIVDVSVWWS